MYPNRLIQLYAMAPPQTDHLPFIAMEIFECYCVYYKSSEWWREMYPNTSPDRRREVETKNPAYPTNGGSNFLRRGWSLDDEAHSDFIDTFANLDSWILHIARHPELTYNYAFRAPVQLGFPSPPYSPTSKIPWATWYMSSLISLVSESKLPELSLLNTPSSLLHEEL